MFVPLICASGRSESGERTGDALAPCGERGLVETRLGTGGEGSDVAVNGASGLGGDRGNEGQDEGVGELHVEIWFLLLVRRMMRLCF